MRASRFSIPSLALAAFFLAADAAVAQTAVVVGTSPPTGDVIVEVGGATVTIGAPYGSLR